MEQQQRTVSIDPESSPAFSMTSRGHATGSSDHPILRTERQVDAGFSVQLSNGRVLGTSMKSRGSFGLSRPSSFERLVLLCPLLPLSRRSGPAGRLGPPDRTRDTSWSGASPTEPTTADTGTPEPQVCTPTRTSADLFLLVSLCCGNRAAWSQARFLRRRDADLLQRPGRPAGERGWSTRRGRQWSGR
jgi:hypothetical protein